MSSSDIDIPDEHVHPPDPTPPPFTSPVAEHSRRCAPKPGRTTTEVRREFRDTESQVVSGYVYAERSRMAAHVSAPNRPEYREADRGPTARRRSLGSSPTRMIDAWSSIAGPVRHGRTARAVSISLAKLDVEPATEQRQAPGIAPSACRGATTRPAPDTGRLDVRAGRRVRPFRDSRPGRRIGRPAVVVTLGEDPIDSDDAPGLPVMQSRQYLRLVIMYAWHSLSARQYPSIGRE